MKLKLLWMYHNIMDLYGDKGNIEVLKKRCLDRNIKVEVDTCGIKEERVLKDYHLIFIGGGADYEQSLICEDLIRRKQGIVEAIEEDTFVLLICGGYQFFGQYYIDNSNNKIEGLKIFDYYTQSNANVGRCIGNIEVKAILDGKEVSIVGFENHGGQTMNVTSPLGEVVFGHGNTYKGTHEGFLNNNVLGTYMHGPLLPKNPEVADFIIKRALEKEYQAVDLAELDDSFELQAKATMIQKIKKDGR